MSYAASAISSSGAENPMSVFKGVTDQQLAKILGEAGTAAAKGLGEELRPAILAIARDEPYELPTTPQNHRATGVISGFLAKMGL